MSDYEAVLRKEEKHRARFEQLVTEGEKRVTEQTLVIQRLRADGHDTTRAEQFLEQLRKNLEEWHQTRTDVTQVRQTYELLAKAQSVPVER